MREVSIFADNHNIILVPVIASFNAEGKVVPLYFSLEGLRLKIDNIKCIKRNTESILEFICEVTFSDRVKTVLLSYHVHYKVWSVNKASLYK